MSEQKTIPFTARVHPRTPDLLTQLSLVYGQPIGKLIDGMVARNFKAIQENGKLDAYLASMTEAGEDEP